MKSIVMIVFWAVRATWKFCTETCVSAPFFRLVSWMGCWAVRVAVMVNRVNMKRIFFIVGSFYKVNGDQNIYSSERAALVGPT